MHASGPVPGPKPGTLGRIKTLVGFARRPLGFVGSRFQRFGDMYYVAHGDGLLVLRHPDHLYEVLVDKAAHFSKQHTAFEQLGRVLGNGLLNSDGEVWRRHRRMIQPAFQRPRLIEYADVMRAEAERVARELEPPRQIDMSDAMMGLTLDIVCQTLFSHDSSLDRADVARAMCAFQDSIARPDVLPSWLPVPGRKALQEAVQSLDAIIYRMIRERKAELAQARADLLARLLAAVDEEGDGSGLTETEVRDQLVTMFLAGHETTSQALTWTWYLLAEHPEVESKLHAELSRELSGRAPSYEDLERLTYTEQVLEEAMRLYPPVYMVARRAEKDTEVGGRAVAAGTELALWIYWAHHDPRWFPLPDAFKPERFAPDAKARQRKGAYLPFGAGPRACIGKVFAMIEAKIILATLAQRFSARVAPGQKVQPLPRITLTPRHGMRMRLS